MKSIIFFISTAILSTNVMAINKCVVNGKTTYQASPCEDESQRVEINLRKITDQEKIKSAEAKKILDAKMAADKKAKEDKLKAYLDARATSAIISGRAVSENEAAMQIINDNTANELGKAATVLHGLSGR